MKVYAIGKENCGIFEMLGTKVYSTHSKAIEALPHWLVGETVSDLTIESFEVE